MTTSSGDPEGFPKAIADSNKNLQKTVYPSNFQKPDYVATSHFYKLFLNCTSGFHYNQQKLDSVFTGAGSEIILISQQLRNRKKLKTMSVPTVIWVYYLFKAGRELGFSMVWGTSSPEREVSVSWWVRHGGGGWTNSYFWLGQHLGKVGHNKIFLFYIDDAAKLLLCI